MKLTKCGGRKTKILVYGASGRGKTYLASTCPTKPLVIDCEGGGLTLAAHDIDAVDISRDDNGKPLQPAGRIARLKEVLTLIDNNTLKHEWVFIDSLSEISQMVEAHARSSVAKNNDTFAVYGTIRILLLDIVRAMRDLDRHVVVTALEHEREQSGVDMIMPAVAGSVGQNVAGYFDEVFYLRKSGNTRELVTSHDKYVVKDRSGKLAQFEAPSLNNIYLKINPPAVVQPTAEAKKESQ